MYELPHVQYKVHSNTIAAPRQTGLGRYTYQDWIWTPLSPEVWQYWATREQDTRWGVLLSELNEAWEGGTSISIYGSSSTLPLVHCYPLCYQIEPTTTRAAAALISHQAVLPNRASNIHILWRSATALCQLCYSIPNRGSWHIDTQPVKISCSLCMLQVCYQIEPADT